MIVYILSLLLIGSGQSIEGYQCPSEVVKNKTALKVQLGDQQVMVSTIGSNAKVLSCQKFGDFWIVKAHLGQAGTSSQTSEDFIYVYQDDKDSKKLKLVFEKKIREEIIQADAGGEVETMEFRYPVKLKPLAKGRLQVVLKNENKTIELPKK